MTTRPLPPPLSISQGSDQNPPSQQTSSVAPKTPISLHTNRRTSPWDNLDPSTIEIVDLTDPSPSRPPRHHLDSQTSERPAKRFKGKDPEIYISLDEDEKRSPPSSSTPAARHKSPFQSGSLNQAKCVICLDSPTDLSATPCGMSLCIVQI